ncbi:MAG: Sad1 / UNC-like C-terminal [Abditibacteriota bacterium]|nr:Sad1 / UNC-like C-terminal [Abditibacteriota bacterium]
MIEKSALSFSWLQRCGLLGWGATVVATSTLMAPVQAQNRVYSTDLTNIAAAANGGRVLESTSTIDNDANFNANNVIDGKVWDSARQTGTSGWASNKFDPVNMDSITLAFAGNSVRRIGKIALNPSSAVAPERWAKDIEVQVSTESAEGPYTAVAQITLSKTPTRQEFLILPTAARYVRLAFRSNWGSDRSVALGEVEIYEAIGQGDPMGQVITQLEGAINDLKRFRQTQIDIAGATPVKSAARPGAKPGARPARAPQTARAKGAAGAQAALALEPATVQLIQLAGGDLAPRLPVSGTNIAAAANGGRIVDSTSTFVSDPAQGPDPAYGPEKLIDGENYKGDEKGSFGWASQGFAPGRQWVTIGFRDDRTKVISKFVLNPNSNQSNLRWARRVDVQVTSDSPKTGPFRTVGTFTLRPDAANQEFTIRPVEAKYVRFVFVANGPGNDNLANADPDISSDRSVSLGEIEIYEVSASGNELDALISRFENTLTALKVLRRQAPSGAATDKTALKIKPTTRSAIRKS